MCLGARLLRPETLGTPLCDAVCAAVLAAPPEEEGSDDEEEAAGKGKRGRKGEVSEGGEESEGEEEGAGKGRPARKQKHVPESADGWVQQAILMPGGDLSGVRERWERLAAAR